MRQRRSISPKLFSSIDSSAITHILFLLFFVLILIVFYADAVTFGPHDGVRPNLPRAGWAIPMPGANREDALLVTVMQDGKVYFDTEQVNTDGLPAKILDRLKDRSVERKVYISVDKRARYGTVKKALDAIRSAGVERIGFLAYQQQGVL